MSVLGFRVSVLGFRVEAAGGWWRHVEVAEGDTLCESVGYSCESVGYSHTGYEPFDLAGEERSGLRVSVLGSGVEAAGGWWRQVEGGEGEARTEARRSVAATLGRPASVTLTTLKVCVCERESVCVCVRERATQSEMERDAIAFARSTSILSLLPSLSLSRSRSLPPPSLTPVGLSLSHTP